MFKVQCVRTCSFAHAKYCIFAYFNMQKTNMHRGFSIFLQHLLHASAECKNFQLCMCNVQKLAHLHMQDLVFFKNDICKKYPLSFYKLSICIHLQTNLHASTRKIKMVANVKTSIPGPKVQKCKVQNLAYLDPQDIHCIILHT